MSAGILHCFKNGVDTNELYWGINVAVLKFGGE